MYTYTSIIITCLQSMIHVHMYMYIQYMYMYVSTS